MTAPPSSPQDTPRTVGRYTLHREIASGGMATVYFGRLAGPIGFSRIVAIKRMHPRLAKDPGFVAMFIDEATLASRVAHPGVVATLDIVVEEGEIFIVMDYVRGQSLSGLLAAAVRAGAKVPVPIATSVMTGVLGGLHAAHEARDKHGAPLGIVHRDVSPHNVLVGTDGAARVMDFGVARAERRLHVAPEGEIVGKPSYMAPEQIRGEGVDRRTDVYSAGVVLWSMLAGRRLFRGEDHSILNDVLHGEIPDLASLRDDVPPALEAAIRRALERDPARRTASARDFALELEAAAPVASATVVGAWVESLAAPVLREREAVIAQMEDTATLVPGAALLEISAAAARAQAPESVVSAAAARAQTRETVPERSPASIPIEAREPTDAAVTRLMYPPGDTTGAQGARSPLALVLPVSAGLAAIAIAAVIVALRPGAQAPGTAAAGPSPTTIAIERVPVASQAVAPEAPVPVASQAVAPEAPATAGRSSVSVPPPASAAPSASATSAPGPVAKPSRRPPSKAAPRKPGDDLGFIPTTNR